MPKTRPKLKTKARPKLKNQRGGGQDCPICLISISAENAHNITNPAIELTCCTGKGNGLYVHQECLLSSVIHGNIKCFNCKNDMKPVPSLKNKPEIPKWSTNSDLDEKDHKCLVRVFFTDGGREDNVVNAIDEIMEIPDDDNPPFEDLISKDDFYTKYDETYTKIKKWLLEAKLQIDELPISYLNEAKCRSWLNRTFLNGYILSAHYHERNIPMSNVKYSDFPDPTDPENKKEISFSVFEGYEQHTDREMYFDGTMFRKKDCENMNALNKLPYIKTTIKGYNKTVINVTPSMKPTPAHGLVK
jgi:hypothetical protein